MREAGDQREPGDGCAGAVDCFQGLLQILVQRAGLGRLLFLIRAIAGGGENRQNGDRDEYSRKHNRNLYWPIAANSVCTTTWSLSLIRARKVLLLDGFRTVMKSPLRPPDFRFGDQREVSRAALDLDVDGVAAG